MLNRFSPVKCEIHDFNISTLCERFISVDNRMKLLLIFVILVYGHTCNAHRILGLFPHPGYSHFSFFQPIMAALAEAGHEVTVVSQFANQEPIENYKDELLPEVNEGLLNFVSLEVEGSVSIEIYGNLNVSIISSTLHRNRNSSIYLNSRC